MINFGNHEVGTILLVPILQVSSNRCYRYDGHYLYYTPKMEKKICSSKIISSAI
jgi:hypothetical protein